MLLDFESDADLDRIHWECHTLMSLSGEHVTHGRGSLRLELYPSPYPGLAPKLAKTDWSGYRELSFDITNIGDEEVSITVRIDDREKVPEYKDRYNQSFVLKKGMNQISIPLDSLVTSDGRRKLDLGQIYRLVIFTVNPGKKVVLYVDYLRLSV